MAAQGDRRRAEVAPTADEGLTAEDVRALAPDEASRRAACSLSAPGMWARTGSAGGAVWGLCEGSESEPYRTVVDLGAAEGDTGTAGGRGAARPGASKAPGWQCSCPSGKRPCKHALGLLLLWSRGHAPAKGQPPEWAGEWLRRRRERAAGRTRGGAAEASEGNGESSAPTDAPAADAPAASQGVKAHRVDERAARRRAEQRMLRVAGGAEELEERLLDLLRGGLADAPQDTTGWEETASRMVDAQAPGLAARVRDLGAAANVAPAAVDDAFGGRPGRLLSECALLHLLNRGLLELEHLPGPLAGTVRARAGLTVGSAELLAGESTAEKVRDEWLVLAQRDTDEGPVTARRTWLRGLGTGLPALLLSYARDRGHQWDFTAGSVTDGELAYYPGACPLRAALGERHGDPVAGPVPEGASAADALASYGQALADDPWLDAWPAVLSGAVPVFGPSGEERGTGRRAGAGGADDGPGIRQLADTDGRFALPVAPGVPSTALWKLAAVSGGRPVTVFGECGHRGFAPYTAWSEGEAVPL